MVNVNTWLVEYIYLQLFVPIVQQQWCLPDNLYPCVCDLLFNVSKVALAAACINTSKL